MSVKTIGITAYGGPEVLTLKETAPVAIKTGQVRIAVEASGVGLVDVLLRKGLLPRATPAEFIPGIEVAGKVIQGAPEWLGKRVFAKVEMGGYADQVLAAEEDLAEIPEGLSSSAAVSPYATTPKNAVTISHPKPSGFTITSPTRQKPQVPKKRSWSNSERFGNRLKHIARI